ncbi:hypothetical protein BpHYR1_029341 [Brachionus plicatilis]|uniref:Uncharacterized protein n=1 Tax=Brachionus plicatilis TaxID=10195 RepID=A0A3M7PCD4_BRAPC|nr:hypothetical protein BpHYR1_029341 [Brachionus plicatilis]
MAHPGLKFTHKEFSNFQLTQDENSSLFQINANLAQMPTNWHDNITSKLFWQKNIILKCLSELM